MKKGFTLTALILLSCLFFTSCGDTNNASSVPPTVESDPIIKPIDPTNPTESTKPTEEANPTETTKPTEEAKPTETIKPDKPVDSNLAKAFDYNSFSFTLMTESALNAGSYYVEDNNTRLFDGEYDSYIGLSEGEIRYYMDMGDGSFQYYKESSPYFDIVTAYILRPNLNRVDTNKLIKEEDSYSCEASYLNELGLLLTGIEESYTEFSLTMDEGMISMITLKYEGGFYTMLYSGFGTTRVVMPTGGIDCDSESESNVTPIEEIYTLMGGDYVFTEGKITGVYGNNFYIDNGVRGILVYMGKEGSFKELTKIGNVISLTADIKNYAGAYQLINADNITVINKDFEVNPINLTSLRDDYLRDKLHSVANLANATITELPAYQMGADYNLKLSLDGIAINLFIPKHISNEKKAYYKEEISKLRVGGMLSLEGCHVGCHNSRYQLIGSEGTIITGEPVKKPELEIIPGKNIYMSNLDPEAIAFDMTLYHNMEDGSRVEISNTEYTVDFGGYEKGKSGKFTFTFSYLELSASIEVTIKAPEIFKAGVKDNQYKTVTDKLGFENGVKTYDVTIGLPSIGTPRALVIPVDFTNKPAKANMKTNLDIAFNGTSEATGWESLNSYYKKSSYGKLDIKADIMEVFHTNKPVSYYDNLYNSYNKALDDYYDGLIDESEIPESPESEIIRDALALYDSLIDYSKYDYNSDGYIDAIYLVYTEHMDFDKLWWAYVTEYFGDSYPTFDELDIDYYCWMSYDFLMEKLNGQVVNLNCETLIHESGHLMGLNDYYDLDYDPNGTEGGLGGGDMMDANVGDHNAYSKLMLGWVDPTIVVKSDLTIDLNSFGEFGECVIVIDEWNNTFFSEFYIIDFYTPTGLNKQAVDNGVSYLFSTEGIRIYHVDSTLNDPTTSSILDCTAMDNGTTPHKLIKLVEADGRNETDRANGDCENSDLFKSGSIYKDARWYDSTSALFKLSVNSMTKAKANITISF